MVIKTKLNKIYKNLIQQLVFTKNIYLFECLMVHSATFQILL